MGLFWVAVAVPRALHRSVQLCHKGSVLLCPSRSLRQSSRFWLVWEVGSVFLYASGWLTKRAGWLDEKKQEVLCITPSVKPEANRYLEAVAMIREDLY